MNRKPYRFFLYLLLELSSIIIILLPYRLTIFLARFFGGMAYYILPKYRNIALSNLRLAFSGGKSEDEIRQIAKDVFSNIAVTAVECINFRKFNRKTVKRLMPVEEDFRPFKEALAKGKGAIALVGHYGNWEMSGVCTAARDIDLTVIAKRIYYPPYNKFLVSLRQEKGVKTLYRDDKNILRKTLAALKANGLLAIVPDQDVDSVDGVFVNFFGRQAYTPTGPVVIAMLSGAPIMPAFPIREKNRTRLVIEKPIYVERSGDREKDLIKYTQQWTDVLEKYIRRYPSQWAWIHKRWKTRPEEA